MTPIGMNREYENLAFFAIDNIFREMMTQYPYYRIEDDRQLMCLLHLDEARMAQLEGIGNFPAGKDVRYFFIKAVRAAVSHCQQSCSEVGRTAISVSQHHGRHRVLYDHWQYGRADG